MAFLDHVLIALRFADPCLRHVCVNRTLYALYMLSKALPANITQVSNMELGSTSSGSASSTRKRLLNGSTSLKPYILSVPRSPSFRSCYYIVEYLLCIIELSDMLCTSLASCSFRGLLPAFSPPCFSVYLSRINGIKHIRAGVSTWSPLFLVWR